MGAEWISWITKVFIPGAMQILSKHDSAFYLKVSFISYLFFFPGWLFQLTLPETERSWMLTDGRKLSCGIFSDIS